MSVCLIYYSKNYEQILMKFFWRGGCGPRNDQLDFGDNPIVIWIKATLFSAAIATDSRE